MKTRTIVILLLCMMFSVGASAYQSKKDMERIERLLVEATKLPKDSNLMLHFGKQFLGVPYVGADRTCRLLRRIPDYFAEGEHRPPVAIGAGMVYSALCQATVSVGCQQTKPEFLLLGNLVVYHDGYHREEYRA